MSAVIDENDWAVSICLEVTQRLLPGFLSDLEPSNGDRQQSETAQMT